MRLPVQVGEISRGLPRALRNAAERHGAERREGNISFAWEVGEE